VQIAYKPAGRETLAALEQELARPGLVGAEAPVIEISETPAGRETLAAIAEELAESMTRPRQNTLPYGDRISNAPGARAPSRAPAATPSSQAPTAAAPAKSRSRAAPNAPGGPLPAPVAAVAAPPIAQELEIFELLTFLVRGSVTQDLSTDAARRRFVEAHLLRRVPSGSMTDVERIEVTPWTTQGTLVVRVWIRSR
jgi:hypothetical protein